MSREVLQMALAVLKGCLEHPDAQDSIIAIEHELAQPEQEPMHPKIEKLYEDFFDKCFRESPTERQPLRGEQIYELFVKTLPKLTLGMTYVPEWAIPIARAIEAAHGIGDKT